MEEANQPDLFELRTLLHRTSHVQCQVMRPYMATVGLGTGQPKLLAYLARHGSCTQRELADFYDLDPAGVSRMIDALARRGFVEIAPAEGDRRSKIVSMTAEGARVACAWEAACREEARAMVSGFAPEEVVAFYDYLGRARANLKAYSRELSGGEGVRHA